MRGIYLNTNSSALKPSIDFFSEYNHILEESFLGNTITLVYSRFDWLEQPLVQLSEADGGGKMYCSGWFIYKNQRNNLTDLATDYVKNGVDVFKDIELGSFVLVHIDAKGARAVCDAHGVSTHYSRQQQKVLEIAPSVKAFDNLPAVDRVLSQVLADKGHLFGNYTLYEGITRLDPGSETRDDGQLSKYYQPVFDSPERQQQQKVPSYINDLVAHWPEAHRTLAISGGLDSRLILTGSHFEYGYTYGPANSGDRPIARLFADCFNRYEEFEFTAPPILAEETPLSNDFFFGVSTWIPQLMSTYRYSFSKAQGSYVLFDGFQGDVLQRANHLKFAGVLGLLLKTCPWLYKLKFSARFIFSQRYKTLSPEGFELLMANFHEVTDDLVADTYQKIIYYEFVYGRGARFVVNGGNITAGQMYTVVPVFAMKSVFHLLLSQDYSDTVQYKQIFKIWRDVPQRFRQLASDTGVGPLTPYWLAPIKNMTWRLAAHYIPGFGSYTSEKSVRK